MDVMTVIFKCGTFLLPRRETCLKGSLKINDEKRNVKRNLSFSFFKFLDLSKKCEQFLIVRFIKNLIVIT